MRVTAFKYLFAYAAPAVILYSLYAEDYFSFTALVVLFGFIPLIELFTNRSKKNLSQIEEEVIKKDKTFDMILYGMLPVQYFTLGYFLYRIGDPGNSVVYITGATLAMGLSCGILGINVAHELGHRRSSIEKLMSKSLLLTSLYMHFFIEHNRGHHSRVSTDEDPASAQYGESVYHFYLRSIVGCYLSAWSIEGKRLKKRGISFWSFHNEMLMYQLIQLSFLFIILLIFGFFVLFCFLCAAAFGILLLETVNYIEHYGLRRKKKGEGYEKTMPVHSWNSNHPIGRVVLFELSRHSDHHFMPTRKYQVLRHFEESPQMPTGYPGMMWLSLLPPLWYRVMHRSIEQYKKTRQGADLA